MTRQETCKNTHGYTSYSALKTFSVCPNLYKEMYLTKEYVEPHHDYFDYGHIVDSLTTSLLGAVDINWEVVKRRDKKSKKLQVTEAFFKNCSDTAEAITSNPFYKTLSITPNTVQQCILSSKHKRKGIIDIINFSDGLEIKWGLYQGGLISKAELQKQMRGGTITIIDIKTTADIKRMPFDSWANQLAFYRLIIRELTGLNAECYIIAGGKTGDRKSAQDIYFKKETLDFAEGKILMAEKLFWNAINTDIFLSAKEIYQQTQQCHKCSICSVRPLSIDQPLII